LGTIKDIETNEDLVVYKDIEGHPRSWVRPLNKFMMEVDKSKYPESDQFYKFELVTKVTVNNDKKFVKEMKAKLKENKGYSPCSLLKNKDTKCMCKEFREMEEGVCHCGLYYKVPVTK
jgi:hypothetical protein